MTTIPFFPSSSPSSSGHYSCSDCGYLAAESFCLSLVGDGHRDLIVGPGPHVDRETIGVVGRDPGVGRHRPAVWDECGNQWTV